ncbi:ATP-binding protein [Seleniivibrio sp.]|uniref:sensor histidine kinase n=1 Tax=Seleniivibrio sp. TaxID=2898801 RepID=UPI0025CFE6B5|nr:ATP-binding protein [Seleniivibrio sp.]MCD8554573.1 ATP-binding protein [Seleniivibrio sp.]
MAELPEKLDKTGEMEMLAQAFAAFSEASTKLEQKYSIIEEEAKKLREEVEEKNSELSKLSGLLESVLNNSNSCVLASDDSGTVLVKNPVAECFISELGEEAFTSMLNLHREPGVFDHEEDGRTFRISVGRLENLELRGYVYIIDDVSHIKQLEAERQRDEKLVLMGEMAANIAHEIRNPLGSIELFASLLERDLRNDESGTKLTRSIVKGVRTINSIISNILLFTKEIKLEPQNRFVADIVDDVVLYLQHLMKEKNIKFINKINEDHVVRCDTELCKQIVMNIVHNAIEAVPEGGQIVIESFSEDERSGFTVTDNGSGISESMRKKLFIPFQTTKAKGTGLGLAIVYKILKAHSGQISVDSDGATYTRFIVEFPV